MVRFRMFGIPVEVQPFFWVTLALIGGALQARDPESLLKLALFLIAGFVSILIHELGHALMVRSFKGECSITLQAFGGYVAHRIPRSRRLQSFLVTAGGPALQILAGLLVGAAYWFLPIDRPLFEYFLKTFAAVSIIWAVLNLLPILPLDGGHLMDALLGPQRIRITLWVSILCAVGIAVLAIWNRMTLLAIFTAFFAWQSWKSLGELPRR
jgi:stage IV sporulation protein FB